MIRSAVTPHFALSGITWVFVWLLPVLTRGNLRPTGLSNQYYQIQGYFGARMLEHNETGRFDEYAEVTWSQQSALDSSGRLWMADQAYHQIVVVMPSTRYVAFHAYYKAYAGARGLPGHADGSRLQTQFNGPMGLALSELPGQAPILYVSDTNNHVLRRLDVSTGRVSTLAGIVGLQGLQDGPSSRALFNYPMSLGVDDEGKNLFVLDNTRRIRHLKLQDQLPLVTTLVPGACRGVSKWSVVGAPMLRRVGCHPDWRAGDVGDPDVTVHTFDLACVGHQASCGPRDHPALNDERSLHMQAKPTSPPAAQHAAAGGMAARLLSGGAVL